MFNIENVCVKFKNKLLLNNINLKVKYGEIHALMGPNGSGKTTLALTISGHKEYNITSGKIILDNKDITNLSTYERSVIGIFISFQNPIEIPGINNFDFLKSSINSIRKYKKMNEISIIEFNEIINKYIKELKIDESFLKRSLNVNYSGGEKKKNEILQMKILNPCISILDEIDSGLDIDSLKIISKSINNFLNKKKSIIIITHRINILNYIKPDLVHIIYKGKIIKTGNLELTKKVEKFGYDWINR